MRPQGIGRTVGLRLAAEGAQVALVDRAEVVTEVANEIAASGSECLALTADLERYAECSRVMDTVQQRFGRIDVLVNNVGGTIWAKPYAHYAEVEIEAEVRRSLFPTLWCCRAVLPIMVEQNAGTIVNVSSVATRGVKPRPVCRGKGWGECAHGLVGLGICAARHPGVCGRSGRGPKAPPRKIPRNSAQPTAQERAWYQQIVDQTVSSSLMKRYGHH